MLISPASQPRPAVVFSGSFDKKDVSNFVVNEAAVDALWASLLLQMSCS